MAQCERGHGVSGGLYPSKTCSRGNFWPSVCEKRISVHRKSSGGGGTQRTPPSPLQTAADEIGGGGGGQGDSQRAGGGWP